MNLPLEKTKECVWLRPEAVAQIGFPEWPARVRVGHAEFARLQEDRDPRLVAKERASPGNISF